MTNLSSDSTPFKMTDTFCSTVDSVDEIDKKKSHAIEISGETKSRGMLFFQISHLYPHRHWCIRKYKTGKLAQFFQHLAHLTCAHDMTQPDQMNEDSTRMAIDVVMLDYSPNYCFLISSGEMSRLDWLHLIFNEIGRKDLIFCI